MKVLLLTDHMETGGAETHVATLAKGLRDRGVDVSVYSSGGRMADKLESVGIRQIRLFPRRRTPKGLLDALKALRQTVETERFDVLHAHARLPALFLRGCRKWNGSPSPIVTVHAAFHASPILCGICYWGERTIAVSEDLRAHVCDRFHVPAERVTVIPNGIDCALFSPPPKNASPSPYSVLFASRMDRDCMLGAELLCAIAPELALTFPNLTVTLAGGGEGFGEISNRVQKINRAFWKGPAAKRRTVSAPLIHAVGEVTEMPALYRQHQIFVGVSRAAMEAAACGCAVVLCGNEGYGGLLSPHKPLHALSNFCARGEALPTRDALQAELSHLLLSQDLCQQSGEAGRAWMLREFDAAQTVERTLRVYGVTK